MPVNSLTTRLDKVLRQHLPLLPEDALIGADDPLSGLGLDSLGMVRLVLALEEQFALPFPEKELVTETFATAGTLAAVLERLGVSAAGGVSA